MTRGILLILAAALCWSSAGLFTRLLPQDAWSILFWRGLFATVFTGAAAFLTTPPLAILRPRRADWSILLWMTLGSLAFIPALKWGGVVLVAIVYATTPLVVAGLAWALLGEPLRGATLFAGFAVLAGIAIMMGGQSAPASLPGLLLALAMTFSMAMTALSLRRHRRVICWSAAALSNALTAAIAALAAPTLAVSAEHLLWLALFALVQMTLGLGCFALGLRFMPAGAAAFLGLIELPLAPLWVWLVFGEAPSAPAILGGAIVLTAVALHLRWGTGPSGQDRRVRL